MEITDLVNKNILIKTFCFESGLYYLAESLYRELLKGNNQVRFFPKSTYTLNGNMYQRGYRSPVNPQDFARIPTITINPQKTIREQMLNAVTKHNIDLIISMETLMQKSLWVPHIKRRKKIPVIDVPMIEWVTPSYLKNGSYSIFDEIWAVTDFTFEQFHQYNYPVKRKHWDVVDRSVFTPSSRTPHSTIKFYHAGSLNSDFSSKNTDLVILAFDKLLQENLDISLDISGRIPEGKMAKIIDKHTNINVINEVIPRTKVPELLKNVDCVIAPSSKEGLGLSLYEALACGCELITTDAPPMNESYKKYLCKVGSFKSNQTLVPNAIISVDSICEQIRKVYLDKRGQNEY